jgi:hypothetical protein
MATSYISHVYTHVLDSYKPIFRYVQTYDVGTLDSHSQGFINESNHTFCTAAYYQSTMPNSKSQALSLSFKKLRELITPILSICHFDCLFNREFFRHFNGLTKISYPKLASTCNRTVGLNSIV